MTAATNTGMNDMNAINNERYVVALRKEHDTQGTLRTYAFYTIEEANKFAENKRGEVSFDMEPMYSLVKLWDVEDEWPPTDHHVSASYVSRTDTVATTSA